MSHYAERKEKDCLNCGAVVYGRYCHFCGQENTAPKETFWHLVTHFVYDVTHFDGKFFSTVKYLLTRPGYLSQQYIKGKRTSYLNPVKMYVFTSAFFFLLFFAFFKPNFNVEKSKQRDTSVKNIRASILNKINSIEVTLKDSTYPEFAKELMKRERTLLQGDIETLKTDSTHTGKLHYFSGSDIRLSGADYASLAAYDSVQKSLPNEKQDRWMKRTIKRKSIELNDKYGENKGELFEKLLERFLHSFPQIFFVSLPLFAMLLHAMYRRSNAYYVDHIIYSVHLYCAMFIFMFLSLVFGRLDTLNYLHWLKYLSLVVNIYSIWYAYKSLKNFYGQSRVKTIVKLFLLTVMSILTMSLLFIVFFVFSVFTI